MSLADDLAADTASILSEWEEVFTLNRATVTYDSERIPSSSWVKDSSFAGDGQPLTGDTIRAEEGRKIKSAHVIYAPLTADVQEGDQITTTAGVVWYVNYTRVHEDHKEVFVRREEGQAE